MNSIDSTYIYIGIASFIVIATYMIEHENAARAYKGLLKKPYAHHFDNMFFIVFFCIVVLFAYFSLVAAIYCAARLLKGWLGFSILSINDKRKLDLEIRVERRKNAIAQLLGNLPFNAGPEGSWNIPPQANYQQAMAYIAIWLADNFHKHEEPSEQVEHCKRYWLSLRYSAPGIESIQTIEKATALALALPAQVDAYFDFLAGQNEQNHDYWPATEAYIRTNLQ